MINLQACVNNTFKSKLGQSHPKALKALQDRGAGYSQTGTFWGVLNVSLCAYDAQLGLDIVV